MSAGSSNGWLLDTNVISHTIRGANSVRERLHAANRSSLKVCVVVVSELEFGSLKSPRPEDNRARWRFTIRGLPILPFDEAAALEQARLRLALRHQPIGERDLIIIAIALTNNLGVVTGNTSEFRRVSGLHVEDWTMRT